MTLRSILAEAISRESKSMSIQGRRNWTKDFNHTDANGTAISIVMLNILGSLSLMPLNI